MPQPQRISALTYTPPDHSMPDHVPAAAKPAPSGSITTHGEASPPSSARWEQVVYQRTKAVLMNGWTRRLVWVTLAASIGAGFPGRIGSAVAIFFFFCAATELTGWALWKGLRLGWRAMRGTPNLARRARRGQPAPPTHDAGDAKSPEPGHA